MKIGFVDYELDEFHANTYLRIIRAESLAKGFEVAGCTAMTSGGKQWAEENDVPFYDTVEAMNEGVDCFAVLAPSNPEMHLDMCEKVFPCGKPTFVDKTFAPDFETAKRIFELADEWNVPVSSSSALRYTGIQDHVQTVGGRSNVQHMVVFAPGGSVHEYVIHPLEIVVSCMGASVTGVSKRGQGEYVQLLIDYAGGKTATLNLYCG
ncbi:MAG: Gfo/Idh/MocA family oxidoreductase, partial [Candidatus Pacebacteria bacterium]|nr:Gfo/Idh/MocA family oxidoreductase [Candidatus Paceibacterota bacterium]